LHPHASVLSIGRVSAASPLIVPRLLSRASNYALRTAGTCSNQPDISRGRAGGMCSAARIEGARPARTGWPVLWSGLHSSFLVLSQLVNSCRALCILGQGLDLLRSMRLAEVAAVVRPLEYRMRGVAIARGRDALWRRDRFYACVTHRLGPPVAVAVELGPLPP